MQREPSMTLPSPRVLLVEDDPVSRAFLAAALEAMPVEVDAADTCASALHAARTHIHDLWLVDANLPDGHGAGLLQALRAIAPSTPALAHTASRDRGDLDGLIDAGFAEVLIKPLPAIELQAAVRRALHLQPVLEELRSLHCGKHPVWDDEAAASALNGNHAHVAALRGLFLDELPAQRDAVLAALQQDDFDAVRAQLHRLQASCGFVGAARLGDAVRDLQRAPQLREMRDGFAHAVEDSLGNGVLVAGVPASA